MEDEDPDARPREDFNWFAPWQWERIVLIRVSAIFLFGVLCVWAVFCAGFISVTIF